jgi:hypothetical protein
MDLDDGKSAYMTYIRDAMGDVLQHVAERSSGLLRRTYIQAFRLYQDPSIPEEWRQLFDWTFRLWVAIRLSTTSEFIVGDEKLGMADNILDGTSPNSGKIPVPPVLGAQLDLVLIHHIQTKLRRELLDKLQKMILKNKQSTWFVTYLVIFMLLHNAALITAHDAAYARKHGIRVSQGRGEEKGFLPKPRASLPLPAPAPGPDGRSLGRFANRLVLSSVDLPARTRSRSTISVRHETLLFLVCHSFRKH